MKKMTALAALLAVGMGVSTLAQAQSYRGDDRRGPPPHAQANGHYKHDDRRSDRRDWERDHRRDDRRGDRHDHRDDRHNYRGAGPDHRWVQGYRLPPQYRNHQYVVQDWRGHHLHQPPRGYQWVQYGGDYMLVAIATGVISQLILSGMR